MQSSRTLPQEKIGSGSVRTLANITDGTLRNLRVMPDDVICEIDPSTVPTPR